MSEFIGRNGKEFRGVSPEFVKSMEEKKMNKDTLGIYHRITDNNIMFNTESRPRTKSAIESVLTKISNHLDRADLHVLEGGLEFCAPGHQEPFITIPRGENPVVLLSYGLEDMSPSDTEQQTARAFAEGIAIAKGTTRNKLTGEVDRLLRTWEYPVTTSRGEAVGA